MVLNVELGLNVESTTHLTTNISGSKMDICSFSPTSSRILNTRLVIDISKSKSFKAADILFIIFGAGSRNIVFIIKVIMFFLLK